MLFQKGKVFVISTCSPKSDALMRDGEKFSKSGRHVILEGQAIGHLFLAKRFLQTVSIVDLFVYVFEHIQ